MEKLIEKYTMDKVFEVISKHRGFHEDLIHDNMKKIALARLLDDECLYDLIKEYEEDMMASASALACLTMLENELRGEVEY